MDSTLTNIRNQWNRRNRELQNLNKEFDQLVKRKAMDATKHASMQARYFSLKAEMDELLCQGKKLAQSNTN